MVLTINTAKRNIRLAKNAGFCYGVKRAVESTKKLKSQNPDKTVSVLGELIHNSHVILELKQNGIITLEKLPEKGEGICVIRSHGESEDVFCEIRKRGYEIFDLTCEDVKKVQSKATFIAKNGYFTIILGIKEHPEVIAIYQNAKKYSNDVYVASNITDLEILKDKIQSASKVGVVLQTTQTKEFLLDAIDYLSGITKILHIENTICPSTALRQNEARELAKTSDIMIVVGSKKSANTTHQAQILKEITKTIHIEDEKELDNINLENVKNIGVTAGASTPQHIIEKVINKLERIN